MSSIPPNPAAKPLYIKVHESDNVAIIVKSNGLPAGSVFSDATVTFSEVTAGRDSIYLLTLRAATEEVGKALLREMAWYDNYPAQGQTDRPANTTQGNKKSCLANIVRMLHPGEKVNQKGLIFAATPAPTSCAPRSHWPWA